MKTFISAFAFATFVAVSAGNAYELTVTAKDGSLVKSLDGDALGAMKRQKIETTTPWTDGMTVFEGVVGDAFFEEIAPDATMITAVALDDYIIKIPVQVLREDGAIIADRMNGATMSAAEKGPYWIIFDFDDLPVERQSEFRNYSVWQLVEMQLD